MDLIDLILAGATIMAEDHGDDRVAGFGVANGYGRGDRCGYGHGYSEGSGGGYGHGTGTGIGAGCGYGDGSGRGYVPMFTTTYEVIRWS